MLRIAAGIAQQLCQVIAQVRTQRGQIVAAVRNAVVIELLCHGIRTAGNAAAAAGSDILKGRGDRGGAGAEQQRARH
ncbi:hypothetical protein D3C76_1655480 [compost metagenome]